MEDSCFLPEKIQSQVYRVVSVEFVVEEDAEVISDICT